MFRESILIFLACTVTVVTAFGQDSDRLPIIDMHLHSGPPGLVLPVGPPNPVTGEPGPTTSEQHMRETLEMMERYNVVRAIVSGTVDSIRPWQAEAPGKILGSLDIGRPGFGGSGEPLPGMDELRSHFADGTLVAIGEITAQYEGLSMGDAGYVPYYALAEELNVPVGVHTGTTFPGAAYAGTPNFRVSLGNPILIEDVLVQHPNLRLYLMHGGSPWEQEALAIMGQYPQVYMDISPLWLNWGSTEFSWLFEQDMRRLYGLGLGDRIMFGTDQMLWPESIGMAIEMIESATFLTEEQKRDILYNNAARFLGLSKEEMARDHGR